MNANSLFKRLSFWLKTPDFCCLCQESDNSGAICTDCRTLLPENFNACRICSVPIKGDISRQNHEFGKIVQDRFSKERDDSEMQAEPVCLGCLQDPPSYRSAIVPYLYDFPVDFLVHGLKYRRDLAFGRAMGLMLARAILAKKHGGDEAAKIWDCMLPVPLASHKLRTRGFNQAFEIAQWCAPQLGLDIERALVGRRQSMYAQSSLGRQARLLNLDDMFYCTSEVAGMKILVIDDVMTTGATVESLSSCLLDAGALSVDVCAFARS